jgi:signal transduction histidine kinase
VDLGPIGDIVGRLAVTGLVASGVLILIAGGVGAVVIRAILRPLPQAEGTLAAAAVGERISRVIADTCHELRRPLSVIHGLAGPGRHRGRLSAGELDQRMQRVIGEAARMDALVDDLLRAGHDQPPPQR